MRIFLLLIAALLPSIMFSQNFQATQNGNAYEFDIDLSQSPLVTAESIDLIAFSHNGSKVVLKELPYLRTAKGLHGHGVFAEGETAVMMVLESGDISDNNKNEGYFIQKKNEKGVEVPESWVTRAILYREQGRLYGLNANATTALELFEKGAAAQADLKRKYLSAYVNLNLAVRNNDKGKAAVSSLISTIENDANPTERERTAVMRYHERNGNTDRAAELKTQILKVFPKGQLARQERRKAILNESELGNIETMINKFREDFPPQNAEEEDFIQQMKIDLCNKIGDLQDWDKMRQMTSLLPDGPRASVYNNFAWELAEKGESLTTARELAANATATSKAQIEKPTGPKPDNVTATQWLRQRKNQYATCADTYAYVLDKSDDPYGAAQYQAEAVAILNGRDIEMNERYVNYLEKAKSPELRYTLESFIINGHASTAMKDMFKKVFAAENRSDDAYAAHIAGLERIARERRQKELAAQMVDIPAPNFSLQDITGIQYELEKLRGKVVVVDFWATWCGPCKASFPAMQKAVLKYKHDSNVVFLFVNTWEKAADKTQNASAFINGKLYPFTVLMDLDDSVVSSFGVAGIPTKFVVDPKGKICFKSVGFEGSDDALVDEISAMIELAKSR